jgi:hypothetical protein
MAPDPTIYDYLTTKTVSAITQAQLNSGSKNTYAVENNIEFWKGPITLHRVLEASRTYPGAQMPIPELSAVANSPPFSESAHAFIPSGTEIWAVKAIQVVADGGTDTAVISLNDGSSTCMMYAAATSTSVQSFFPWESPLLITGSLYLEVENSGTNNFTCAIAYDKVGL